MFPGSIKDVASMHALVVVQQNNVSLCHLDESNILHGDLVHVLELILANVSIVTKEHVGLVDLGSTVLEALGSVADGEIDTRQVSNP